MLGNFYALVVVRLPFSKNNFFINIFRNTIILSNGLDPDQGRRSVGTDLGPNWLQRLSADDKAKKAKKDGSDLRMIKPS